MLIIELYVLIILIGGNLFMLQACLFRGLNPFSSSRETLVLYLKDWIKISSKIDNDSLSCILHCQVLLALNRPENDILKKTE